MDNTLLRPYQIDGAVSLARWRKHILGDEPGLGKTRTVLTAAGMVNASRILVVCPAIVRPHWRAEANRIGGIGAQLDIMSYQQLVSRGADVRKTDLLLVDEFHFCKHRGSKRAVAVFGGEDGLAARVLANGGRVWLLSGTPMPRHPGELFSVLYALWPRLLARHGLRTYLDWLNRFCVWKGTRYGVRVFGARGVPELKELLGKVMTRRLTRNVAPDLPPLRWGVLEVTGPGIAKALAAQAEVPQDVIETLSRGELPSHPQLARFRHIVGDLKAGLAVELIHDELSRIPVTSRLRPAKRVIFAYHRSVLDTLQRGLEQHGVVRIDGSTTQTQREERKRQFVSIPHYRVFLGQIGACATGFDGLQAVVNEAVMVEPDWSSDLNTQAAHRLARLGQTLPVQVRMLAFAGTLDDAIVRNHHREVSMRQAVTG